MSRRVKVGLSIGGIIALILAAIILIGILGDDDEPPVVFEPRGRGILPNAWFWCADDNCDDQTAFETYASAEFWDATDPNYGKVSKALLGTDQWFQGVRYARVIIDDSRRGAKRVCMKQVLGDTTYTLELKFNKFLNGKIQWLVTKTNSSGTTKLELLPNKSALNDPVVPEFFQQFNNSQLWLGGCDETPAARLEFRGREQD